MARAWGVWTRSKLDLLEKYLDRFTTASKGVPERVYLDLFGGEPENFERDTLNPVNGSARIALDTADPPFTRLRFFELPHKAVKLRRELAQRYPGRNVIVYAGDCNLTIHQALEELRRLGVAWAPTFAFIDPNGPHCHWSTIEALANHKDPRLKTKVELWMLFAVPLFQRMLPKSGAVRAADNEAITAMYGTPAWHSILQAKLNGEISASAARKEYVNLMRWRLEKELGYTWTQPLLVRNTGNNPLYYMLFATDSPPGQRIMRYLYEDAAVTFPQMIKAHRDLVERMKREADGVVDLFSAANVPLPVGRASAGRARLLDDPPEEPRWHDPALCRFCAPDAPWDYEAEAPSGEYWLDEEL